MSKAKAQNPPAEEEEWEDVDEDEEYEEEEEDTSIANSDVVMRYKAAAKWANEVLTAVAAMVKPEASVAAICKAGNALIEEKVKTNFRTAETKGPAFPVCVSVNGIVCHCNGTEGDVIIALNDVCRIDLGVQVDGYSAMVATTVHATVAGELNPDSKEATLIAGGNAVMEAAVRQLRPGNTTTQVADVIEKCAAHFGLTPVEGTLSHQMKRYIVDGFKTIPCKASSEHKVHEYDIEENTVWCLDVVLTTGKGLKLKEKDMKPCIYKAAIDSNYEPKLQAAFEVRGEVANKFQYFPFATAALESAKAKLGLSELNKHGWCVPYPVLCERDGEVVVHFKTTVLVTPKKIEKVTGIPIQKGAAPVAPYPEELAAKAKQPLSLVDKKKK